MKFTTTIATIASIMGAAQATAVRYDTGYGDASRSLTAVACSDGANGLITRYGWQTQGQVSGFPYIGASDTIAGWNSPNCGQCLQVSYQGRTIHVLALDHANVGLVVSDAALNALTNGQAVNVGVIDATVTAVPGSACGLPNSSKREIPFEA